MNDTKCTECGLCQKHCPVLVNNTAAGNFPAPEAWAAWSKDEETRMSSSSGGVFTEVATEMIRSGGVVFGAVWTPDFLAEHVCVDSIPELYPMKGSKYVQSNMGYSYKRVLTEIDRGKGVLFSGVPCQIAALKTFTKSASLIAVDLICHGIPSILAFKKYLEFLAPGKKIERINFRDKVTGWSHFSLSIEYADGTLHSERFDSDDFCQGFNDDLYLNNLCYECPFASLPRQGDITIGDFWGVPEQLKDEKGISVILANNEKGRALIGKVSAMKTRHVDFQVASKGNRRLTDGNKKKPGVRTELLEELRKNGFKNFAKRYLDGPE